MTRAGKSAQSRQKSKWEALRWEKDVTGQHVQSPEEGHGCYSSLSSKSRAWP